MRRRGIEVLAFADLIACVGPIGLFFGRIANFINGELFGRVSDVPWAMVFPKRTPGPPHPCDPGPLPRHPSQLYEAALEGIVLFVILHLLWRKESLRRRPGLLFGAFLVGYALFRGIAELFRRPDCGIGFMVGGTTMGQLLSAPMVLLGLYFIHRALARKAADSNRG